MGPAAGSKRMELTLLEELASGTFARVYLAEAKGQGGVDRLVAVKVLREKWVDSEEVLARTRDEARLLARLRHKHIVRVEELSEFDNQPAIIMEYVEGMTLQQLLDHLKTMHRAFPARATLQIGMATASALDAAYRRVPYGHQEPLRVVHRDVKPSNVMLSIDGELKVLDFGTARASSPLRSAQTGMVRFGSWKYMSPERKEGDRGDHSADIYSLGLLLIELLGNDWVKGLPVSPGEHDNQLRRLVEGLHDVGMPNDAWARALKDLLLQMAAFSPDVRPSAQQLVEVLRQYGDQASGQTMDALAADVVQGELRGKRENLNEGVLTGTRLFVSLDGSAPPQARRVDGSPVDEQSPLTDPFGAPQPAEPQPRAPQPAAPRVDFDEDDFDEPATVVEPYPSPGRYAVANPGAAQVRFTTDDQPLPEEPEHTEPTPAEMSGFGAPQPTGWDPQPAPEPAPQPRVTFDPAPTAESAVTPAPQPAAMPAPLPVAAPAPQPAPWEAAPQPVAAPAPQPAPWEAAPQAFEPAPAHAFAPAGSDPAETDYLPPPGASPEVAPGPSGPIIQGPVAGAPTPLPDAVPPKKKKSKLPLILGVLVLLFLLCAGIPAVGWVAYSVLGIGVPTDFEVPVIPPFDAPDDAPDDPVVDEPDDAPPDHDGASDVDPTDDTQDQAGPAAGEVAVTIRAADRAIRRIELSTPDGELIQGSKGSIEAHAPLGPYLITVKVAGRDPVTGDLRIGELGLDLLCAPDDKMVKVLCKNADGDITLVLK
jgi:serine/threonine protein kinase